MERNPAIQVIDQKLFGEVAERAQTTIRRRLNHNFHSNAQDNPHRFLNVLLRGTYIRPHRHLEIPKAEAFLVLEGIADVIIFDEVGNITDRYRLGDTCLENKLWGVDLPPGVWHTVVAITDHAVCYEVKPGPWEPSSDKEFADWSPAEGEPAAAALLEKLISC